VEKLNLEIEGKDNIKEPDGKKGTLKIERKEIIKD
jgi:hypothetical protein